MKVSRVNIEKLLAICSGKSVVDYLVLDSFSCVL